MKKITVCVTGATGGLGSRVLHHLLHTLHAPPANIIVSTANTKSTSLPQDVTVRRGDYLSPPSLEAAYAGAEKLLLVSYPSIAHEIRVKAHTNAINAAVTAGIKHVYYTSLAFSSDSEAAVMQAHLDTEAYLKKTCQSSGMKYTIIREGIYAESYPLYLGYLDLKATAANSGDTRVVLPCGSTRGVAWVAKDELGEGTAKIMVDSTGRFDNRTVVLTGTSPISISNVARAVSDTWGWKDGPLRVEEVGQKDFIEYQVRRKTGDNDDPATRDMVTRWSTTYPAIEKGELDLVDPLLQELLGRDLKTIDQTIQGDHAQDKS
jgi:uncharacterized protein YbjT (DUF2867 family)